MKGIIAEINKKYAVILTQDGSFRKIKAASGMAVGCEVNLNQNSRNIGAAGFIRRISSIAAASLVILGIGYGAYSYAMPYSYVDLDINPSFEITSNIYDRIIKIDALNDEGEKLLSYSKLKNVRLEDGVAMIINKAAEQGYLKQEPLAENTVLLTVSSNNGKKSENLVKEVEAAAAEGLDKSNIKSEILIAEASLKQKDEARKFGVTPGKLVLIEDAIEGNPDLKLEELKKAPVRELVKKARDKKQGKAKENDTEENENTKDKSNKDNQNQSNIDNEKNNNTSSNSSNVTNGSSNTVQSTPAADAVPVVKSSDRPVSGSLGKTTPDNKVGNAGTNNNKDKNKGKNKKYIENNNNSDIVIDITSIPEKDRQEMKQLRDELIRADRTLAGTKDDDKQTKDRNNDSGQKQEEKSENKNGDKNNKK